MVQSETDIRRCIEFLLEIGLTSTVEMGVSGFSKGIEIWEGELFIDPDVASVSTVLHEAGHLATTPTLFRHLMCGDVQHGQKLMLQEISEAEVEIDSPLYRAAIQCSDPEATAWAWAAGKFLGFQENKIIDDADYSGEGADIRLCLSFGRYIGINGLANAGLCVVSERMTRVRNLPVYPKLARWIQPSDLSPHAPVATHRLTA